MIPTAIDSVSSTRHARDTLARAASRRHIVHLIGTLEHGGAELFMWRLTSGIAAVAPEWTQTVWVIGARGPLAEPLEAAGVPVRAFEVVKSARGLWRIAGLAGALAHSRVSLLQTWMYHADAVAIAARVRGLRAPQVWTLRQSNLSADVNRPETRALITLCAWCSGRVPAAIVAGSTSALDAHRAVGYSARRMPVIHNGVDTQRFQPNPDHRAVARRLWGVDESVVLIGYLARVSPVKDHMSLLTATAQLARRTDLPPWRLVCVGQGTQSPEFASLVAERGLQRQVICAGHHSDPTRMLPAFDIAVSSSLGEGFPNAVAEAMACAIPVVATDVGDTRLLLRSSNWVVPPANPKALADTLERLLTLGREARALLGQAARQTVEHGFREIDAVHAYVALYRSLMDAPTARVEPGPASPGIIA